MVSAVIRIWCGSSEDARRVWRSLFLADWFAAMFGSNIVFSDTSRYELLGLMETLGVERWHASVVQG